jgi:hypothetical protein
MKLCLAKVINRDQFMTSKTPRKPSAVPASTLSGPTLDLKQRLLDEFDIRDAHGLAVLDAALRAFDVMQAAQKLVDERGVCVVDRWNQLRANPACVVLRDSRAAYLRGLQMLNLDLEPLEPSVGRPRGK